jgi:hypothetical protein
MVCQRAGREPTLHAEELVASFSRVSLKTEADVQRVVANAAHAERAVLFVNVDWSLLEPMRTRYAHFMLGYQQAHPNDGLLFHYVDCTPVSGGYAPLRALPGWTELEEARRASLIHGWGEVVWMAHGRVLHVEPILECGSPAQLVAKTERLLAARMRN